MDSVFHADTAGRTWPLTGKRPRCSKLILGMVEEAIGLPQCELGPMPTGEIADRQG